MFYIYIYIYNIFLAMYIFLSEDSNLVTVTFIATPSEGVNGQ